MVAQNRCQLYAFYCYVCWTHNCTMTTEFFFFFLLQYFFFSISFNFEILCLFTRISYCLFWLLHLNVSVPCILIFIHVLIVSISSVLFVLFSVSLLLLINCKNRPNLWNEQTDEFGVFGEHLFQYTELHPQKQLLHLAVALNQKIIRK